MKTLLVLAALVGLVGLVGLGVWNSPKAAHDEGYSVVRTMKLTGELVNMSSVIIDEAIVYEHVKADEIPWAEYTEGVKNADEIAKNFSAYDCEAIHPFSPVCKRVDGVLTDLDLRALQHPGRGMEVDLSTPRAPTPVTPFPSPVSAQSDYAGLIGQSPWIHALSRRDAERGLEGGR